MRLAVTALFAALLICSVSVGNATTIHVPADHLTIQAGIDAAVDGDTVLLADGTYIGDGNRDIDFLGKAIVVMSPNGPQSCVIHCEATYSHPHRGFIFRSGEDSTSRLVGLKIVHGIGPDYTLFGETRSVGGAIACVDASSPTISACVIQSNSAFFGGAVFVDNSTPIVVHSTLDDNVAWTGGAMYFSRRSRSARLEDCVFFRNIAEDAGGAIAYLSAWDTLSIDGCTFRSNAATTAGAIIAKLGLTSAFLSITASTCEGNVSMTGSVLSWRGDMRIHDSQFLDNAARSAGPPVFDLSSAELAEISKCVFSSNRGSDSVPTTAIIRIEADAATIRSCTLTDNQQAASLLSLGSSPTTIDHCIIAGNSTGAPVTGTGAAVSCTDVFGNTGGDYVGDIVSEFDIKGNISVDPLFCDVAAGNYDLRNTSPCCPERTACRLMGALPVGCE